MFFRNLQLFRLDADFTLTAGDLEEKLATRTLQPCSAMSTESRGWVSPRDDDQLVHGVEKHLLIALGVEQKILPAAVINEAVKQRAAEFEQEKGFKPGRKQLRDIKDVVSAELLPRAFSKRTVARAWIDPVAKLIVVDTSSPARAEQLIETLRDTLGELSVSLPQTECSPGQKLTEWLSARRAPSHFDLGEECELTGTDAAKSLVRYTRHSLDVEQIHRHLEEGLRASRLALTWSGRLSLQVNDKLQIKRVRFIDIEEAEAVPSEDPERRFEADFLLMTGQLGPMLADLLQAFGSATVAPVATPTRQHHEELDSPDPLYDDAVSTVRETGKATVSWIQRRLTIGYNRAARLVERMESEGLVGPSGVGGHREILMRAAA